MKIKGIMTRLAVVEKDRCNPDGCGDYLCIRLCPINRAGKECITKGITKKAVINEELCTGCGICPKRCPFEAISIINLTTELKTKPLHRYGKNEFTLYSLPIPRFNSIVGIIGKNGIGKSTAIKILAGMLKPNLNNFTKPASNEEILDYFKGTEAQAYFEKLFKHEIKVSYKPQQVELIAKSFKGTVKELLNKVDEKDEIESVTKELEIDSILDRDISKVSGGELQRVAIAATVLKKANVYLFDEPTSYLDIKQRIKVSKYIKTLANENTAVLVIEHDLIILDYMTEHIHLMYGKPGCYGVVSLPKATRTGINIYLSGFLPDENIRFRDKAIKFDERAPRKKKRESMLTSWNEINLKLDGFKLNSEVGSLMKEEVVGVLGENGIGKTTFVKVLANILKPSKGEILKEVKVSYKPQYLEPTDETVSDFLKDAIEIYENQLIIPLELKPLLQRKLTELSGGELQRVMITKCLAEKADLFLLDEPSAYLDVEQRLFVSKLIKNIMEERGKTALIVDHDLLFLDYFSERLMVFRGKPSKEGTATGPYYLEEGMTKFLCDLEITLRRDHESQRPRINKPGSVKDREQKESGKYYYC